MLAAPRRALLALVLVVLTLVSGGCGRRDAPASSTTGRAGSALSATPPTGALQEVPPPGAVQQLNERLNEHAPQLDVLAPADNALLPAGPWTLQLRVNDWPLADAGELGLGPHLVVQLDDQEPLRISSAEAAASISMPELRPGSHRVTVYAARPWGEAVKAPGASRQIQLHRVSRNGTALPAPGSAQLIASSPDGLQQAEPVLIDWLLLDAPLQNLRGDDARWRLRISVNGDSFLVDRQTPLWLKGFKRGSNAVQLELLDGRGDPLNPPFNSVVREVLIGSGSRPAWQRSSLSPSELALLSGERPPEPAAAELAPEPVESAPPSSAPLSDKPRPDEPLSSEPVGPQAFSNEPVNSEQVEPEPDTEAMVEQPEEEATADAQVELAPAAGEPVTAEPTEPESTEPEAAAEPAAEAAPNTADTADMAETAANTGSPAPASEAAAAPEKRVAPQTSLSGSAREQVNADGSLQQPPRRGPLAGLREKLGG